MKRLQEAQGSFSGGFFWIALLCKVPFVPCNGTSTPPKLVVIFPFPHHSALQWHPQWHHVHSPKVGRHPPLNHSTLQWHPAMAPPLHPGATSTPPKCPLPQTPNHSTLFPSPHHSTLQWHTAMAPSNGTTSTPVGRHPPPQP